jgi:hypothetical protein
MVPRGDAERPDAVSVVHTRIKILTVHDHPLLREGVAVVLEGQPDL